MSRQKIDEEAEANRLTYAWAIGIVVVLFTLMAIAGILGDLLSGG